MLIRTQVLFEDWQVEYFKDVAERNDISFSEVCRLMTSLGMVDAVTALHPEYKLDRDVKHYKKFVDQNASEDVRHQLLSKLYFEARKAVEYRTAKTKKKKR